MRGRRALVILGVVTALGMVGAGSAQGYVIFGKWSGNSAGLSLHPSLPSSFVNAQGYAAGTWTAVTTSRWVFVKQSGAQNKLSYGPIDGGLGILAETFVSFNGSGFISDADVLYDSAENWYTGSGTPGGSQIDLRSVATHEFGHITGIDHSQSSNCPGSSSDPTMCPFYTLGSSFFRTLENDDRSALAANYPQSPDSMGGKVVVHALYAGMSDRQLANLSQVAFEGTVVSVAAARWNSDAGTRWTAGANGAWPAAYHKVTFRVTRSIRGHAGRTATITVMGNSPAGSIDGSLAGRPDHNLKVGDSVLVLATPGSMAWSDGTTRPTLRFAGAPMASVARTGTARFAQLRSVLA
jgi:matrixin